ncbi:MAG: DUF1015 family protein [Clostridiales Family XIII bacterium]|jgi:uncharacterized protein (DUF1015 family)|nr:DUF1015 family protein [Clostridiales Family XIII bacterium]
MAIIRPFKAIRPDNKIAQEVCALPYDVMNRTEAKAMAEHNPHRFLHISRSEIDLPDEVPSYDDAVYAKAKENLDAWLDSGVMREDDKPYLYIYKLDFNGHSQTGIVAAFSIDEYETGHIKKHELTREAKELDRIRHFDAVSADTEPVFLAYKNEDGLLPFMLDSYKDAVTPEYSFTLEDGVTHTLWRIVEDEYIADIVEYFTLKDNLYIADGHHRSASAYKVGKRRREAAIADPNSDGDYDPDADYNYFMAVLFPDDELEIMDYNRVVYDLNGLDKTEFLEAVGAKFDIVEVLEGEDADVPPRRKHEFAMYLAGTWYLLTANEGTFDANDVISSLDAEILQKNLLQPILGIEDPRTSDRIDFVGGIRGLRELSRRVDELPSAVAFAIYPVSMEDLFDVADAGSIMPPKSTWFEPKLGSGLFVKKI